jgi:hypothetical protein
MLRVLCQISSTKAVLKTTQIPLPCFISALLQLHNPFISGLHSLCPHISRS